MKEIILKYQQWLYLCRMIINYPFHIFVFQYLGIDYELISFLEKSIHYILESTNFLFYIGVLCIKPLKPIKFFIIPLKYIQ